MCKHQLKITVRKDGEPPISIAEFRKLSLFERLSSKWFGQAKKVMLLISEDSVQSLEIKEVD
ncbi:MAG: hypothetical protein V8P98_01295 [Acutalibacteraceae bacterium]|jgi:hypothetical protein|nr:MAG TPA: hypothetical protein [Caudoviricetes sp.]